MYAEDISRNANQIYAELMSIEEDALRLRQLDQQVVHALVEGDFDAFRIALPAYVELREKLRLVVDGLARPPGPFPIMSNAVECYVVHASAGPVHYCCW